MSPDDAGETRPTTVVVEYPCEEWLTPSETLAYSDYWNNEAREQEKPFWVLGGGFDPLEAHLRSTGLVDQLDRALDAARREFGVQLRGTGCDLAAGNLWATPHLLRRGAQKVYSVEYSRHRLLKLGPVVLSHYGVRPDQAVLVIGNFEKTRFQSGTLDFVLMSAAFHHSDNPAALLVEIRRILKPGGLLLIIGEHDVDIKPRHYFTQPIKFVLGRVLPGTLQHRWFGRLLSTDRLWPDQAERQVVDAELGDHSYTREQYRAMFDEAGFRVCRVSSAMSEFQAFALVSAAMHHS